MSMKDSLEKALALFPFAGQKIIMERLCALQKQVEILNAMVHVNAEHNMKNRPVVCEISLAEHCNLNCYGCDHFSPLAEPEFADPEETERDLARLAELFGHRIRAFYLAGGEPLLHPEIIKFMEIARKALPDSDIEIITNGILLPKQTEEFWLACRKYNIAVRPTKYPIDVDYEAMAERARQYGVEYFYWGSSGKVLKQTTWFPLDLHGQQREGWNFGACVISGECLALEHGRLYTCTVAARIRHFNKYFGTNLKLSPRDSIDLYRAKSEDDINEYLVNPIPFCRYCTRSDTQLGMPWHRVMPWRRSKRDIKEWTL